MHRQNLWTASTIIGDRVRNPAGENLGKIEDTVVDPETGRIMYAVLSFGGFLGMGDKLFAIPWDALRLGPTGDYLILDVDRETLQRAHGFDRNHWPDMEDPAWQARTHGFFGRDSSPRRYSPPVRDETTLRDRPVVVEREVHRAERPRSIAAVFFLALLLIGLAWLTFRVSTVGWERTKGEVMSSMQGAAYAMKETSEDATLTAKVKTSFSLSRSIPSPANINVDSKDGIVTLRGEVASQDIRTRAEELARDVPGVRDVRNHIYAMGSSY